MILKPPANVNKRQPAKTTTEISMLRAILGKEVTAFSYENTNSEEFI